ncbi:MULTISPECIES: hypothetical protein [Sphingomonadales]|jgi:hypothetical protein|nr:MULTISPECIES: hypothetical protein [Sphingomonadaceae]ASY46770.1 hypothetical protein CJD35_19950 [Sphingobium xenophagum]MBB3928052.1 hypothetical protein [Sphingobium jiangsuense]MDQ4422047.1 hypothetical protein [Sphingobium sp. DEHP117]GBH30704.1 hypothetical protein MBESOW_P1959 [Sphingobium xenophagum]|tara:strand:+ start:760 stop:1020 length:261 start_codon:yes stop_codon:yes gene_type:complete
MTNSGREIVPRRAKAAPRTPESIDIYDPQGIDSNVRRALAVVLMREAMAALEQAGEQMATCHLQAAIDSLMRRRTDRIPPEKNCRD